jgi:hypothetical protein
MALLLRVSRMTATIQQLLDGMKALREAATPNARELVDEWVTHQYVKMEEDFALRKLTSLQLIIAQAVEGAATNQERLERALLSAVEAIEDLEDRPCTCDGDNGWCIHDVYKTIEAALKGESK